MSSLDIGHKEKKQTTKVSLDIGHKICLTTPILRVAVFSPLRQCFDYLAIENLDSSHLKPGLRVEVPFGRQTCIGIVTEVVSHSALPKEKLKRISKVLDTEPIFPKTLYQFIVWASNYYHHPLGEVFATALPAYLRSNKSCEQEEGKSSPIELTSFEDKSYTLNAEQENAVHILTKPIMQQKFQPFLLQGVTGSGKTEVYLELIAAALHKEKQALILVPEIGLTPQMLARLKARFSVPIAVLHSGLTEKQRFLAWNQARLGATPIVLGTRSAIFTPLAQPGVFILDEEHDPSFKQQDNFRYSARDLLIMRGSLEHCPVVLGSATPSLETIYNVEKHRYQKVVLENRFNAKKSPKIQILDIRHKKLKEGLSHALMKHIQQHLEAGGQVLLFLNRRGFAPIFMCFDCGHIAQCKHCDAKLTLHYQKRVLKCHHCEFTQALYQNCPSCGNHEIKPLGVGTERLEKVLAEHFKDFPIVRIDRDTTRKKNAIKSAIEQIQQGGAQILLGTQMLAKGHHFPNLSLVAILDIDNALFSLDFRGMERLGQLLTQVAGRAGRAERKGEVVLQTCHPTHPLLEKLVKQGYESLTDTLLMERQVSGLPPYSHQALLRVETTKSEKGHLFLTQIKSKVAALKIENLELLGPISAVMEKRAGKYHAQLLLQAKHRKILHQVLNALPAMITELTVQYRGVRWILDIDPIEMF